MAGGVPIHIGFTDARTLALGGISLGGYVHSPWRRYLIETQGLSHNV